MDFGIIIDNDALKCDSQCPKLIYILAILTMFSKHLSSLMTSLRCFHKILSGLEADKLLYLLMAIVNYFFEKEFHDKYKLEESSSNNNMFTCWF